MAPVVKLAWMRKRTPSLTNSLRPFTESASSHRKFGPRLGERTPQKLEALMHIFERRAVEIIREVLALATPEVFPMSWRVAVEEHRQERNP